MTKEEFIKEWEQVIETKHEHRQFLLDVEALLASEREASAKVADTTLCDLAAGEDFVNGFNTATRFVASVIRARKP